MKSISFIITIFTMYNFLQFINVQAKEAQASKDTSY